jgi:hypothetical protein
VNISRPGFGPLKPGCDKILVISHLLIQKGKIVFNDLSSHLDLEILFFMNHVATLSAKSLNPLLILPRRLVVATTSSKIPDLDHFKILPYVLRYPCSCVRIT